MRLDRLRVAQGTSPLRRFLPQVFPNRTDAVLFFTVEVAHGPSARFIEEHRSDEPLTLFHLVLAAALRTLVERPQLNRTVVGGRIFDRDTLALTFSVKKGKRDGARIVSTKVHFAPTDTLADVQRKVNTAVRASRDPASLTTAEHELRALERLPRPLVRRLMRGLRRAERYGLLPTALTRDDPSHTSAFIANLGSIGLDASFHHLSNTGTASLHMTVGKVQPTVVARDGRPVVEDAYTLRLAIDDRIVDGYYCARSLQRLEHWLAHPEALLEPWPDRPDLVVGQLWHRALHTPEDPAYWLRSTTENGWFPTTWMSLLEEVRAAGRALIDAGVEPGDRVCIQGSNRPEWTVGYLGAQAIGAVPCGLHEDLSTEGLVQALQVAEPAAVVLETEGPVRTVQSVCPCAHLVTMAREAETALDWGAFLERGRALDDGEVERRLRAIDAAAPAVAVFTSGSSGAPRAALLSHASLRWTAMQAVDALGIGPSDTTVSYLPLSHVAEQNFTIVVALVSGGSVAYAPSRGGVVDTLREFRPTVFFGVPQIWARLRRDWQDGPASVGLDRVRVAMSGAGALGSELFSWFASRGVEVLQTYGQTEGCGPTTLTRPGDARPGTCGPAFPGVEVRLSDEGELRFRGPNVFLGYLGDPEATQAVLRDGWVHSGDVATEERGHLCIRGRSKEILVPTTGENVAPEPIETALQGLPLIHQAVVLGDGRPYLVALLALDAEVAVQILDAAGIGPVGAVHRHPLIQQKVEAHVDAVNARATRSQRVARFAVLPRPLTPEDGELTPTLKLRRQIIAERWAGLVEALYGERSTDWAAPATRTQGFSARVAAPVDHDALFALRHRVFDSAGHLAPSSWPDGRLRDVHDARAVQFELRDPDQRLAGTARLVTADAVLPVETLFAFEGLGIDRAHVGEVGRLAIDPRWRGRRAPVVTLIRATLDHAVGLGLTHVYAFVPARAVRAYAALGLPVWELPLVEPEAHHIDARRGMGPYFATRDPRVVVFTDPGALI